MSRGPDTATLLERALVASAEAGGFAINVTVADWVRWVSATFSGARHMVTLIGERSAGIEAWIAGLPEAEFGLRGHLVADLVVKRVSRDGDTVTAEIEALTVEER